MTDKKEEKKDEKKVEDKKEEEVKKPDDKFFGKSTFYFKKCQTNFPSDCLLISVL